MFAEAAADQMPGMGGKVKESVQSKEKSPCKGTPFNAFKAKCVCFIVFLK